jgi:hypothetical protein
MTFGVNIIPKDNTVSLGTSQNKWKINGVDDPKLTDTTYSNATTSDAGLMSADDKTKLDEAASYKVMGPESMVSVSDAIEVKAGKVLINIEPVQAGSGDPSPTNVRPISGWTGANVTRCGTNFVEIDNAWIGSSGTHNGIVWRFNEDGSITLNGTKTISTPSVLIWNFANAATAMNDLQSDNKKHIPNGDYYIYSGHEKATLQVFGSNDENAGARNSYYIASGNLNPVRFTINNTYKYNWIRLHIGVSAVFDNYTFYPMVRLAPVSDATYDITFPTEAGTVYGGTLDVMKGELVVDRIKITDLSQYSWSLANMGDGLFICQDARLIGIANANSTPLCNKYKGLLPAAANQEAHDLGNNTCCFRYPNFDRFYVNDRNYANVFDFKASLTNMELVYELATPQTYQLTPTEVEMLLGENNVWADTGEITVGYLREDSLGTGEAIADAIKNSDASHEQMVKTAMTKTFNDAIEVTTPTFSTLPKTFSAVGITPDHELVQDGIAYLSNPSAMGNDWTIATGNDEFTISGTCNDSTYIKASFCVKQKTTATA